MSKKSNNSQPDPDRDQSRDGVGGTPKPQHQSDAGDLFSAVEPVKDAPTPTPPAAPPPPAAPDPFDPASLRLSQSPNSSMGVKKALLMVPVRKPDKSWFVRVHPDQAYHLTTGVIELKEGLATETYLVAPALREAVETESTYSHRALFTAVNRQGVIFLWSIRLPNEDGRVDEWSRTSLVAAQTATKCWTRAAANMALGAYDVFEATGDLPEPDWPTAPLSDLLRVAFKDRYINSLDHPVLRRLRGEV